LKRIFQIRSIQKKHRHTDSRKVISIRANRNLFVKIPGTPSEKEAQKWCESNGLKLIKQYKYIPDWYLVSYSGDTIKKSAELVEGRIVEQAEPSFYIPLELKTYVPADEHFFKQWHLHNWGGLQMDLRVMTMPMLLKHGV
jgi:hypothetical protein